MIYANGYTIINVINYEVEMNRDLLAIYRKAVELTTMLEMQIGQGSAIGIDDFVEHPNPEIEDAINDFIEMKEIRESLNMSDDEIRDIVDKYLELSPEQIEEMQADQQSSGENSDEQAA